MNKSFVFQRVVILGLLLVFSCARPSHFINASRNDGVKTDPAIVYGVLSNGFQYILMENALPEDRVNMHLDVFAGSVNETDEQQGAAHFLEHMLFNGSKHFKPGELIEYFQSIGMDFGADANAHTSFFNTVYDLSIPKADHKHINEAFVIIQDYAEGALLLEKEVERERGIIVSEKRQRDSVSYRTFKKSLEFELPDSLINQRFPIGIDSTIKAMDRKRLKAYYDRWYRPDNMALVVVGDFDVKSVEPMIRKRFAKLKPRTFSLKKSVSFKWKEHQGTKTFYHYEPEAGSTEITIENISWIPFEQETPDALKKRILKQVTMSMLENRLSRMVSKQSADFSDASVFTGSYMHHISTSGINATCEPGKWEKSLSQIEKVLRQGLLYGFTEKELDRVKSDFISSLEKQLNQKDSQKSHDLSRKIVRAVNGKRLLLSARQRKDLLEPYINSISLQDANNSLKNTWAKDHRLILVTGNAKIDTKEPEQTILNTYQKSWENKVSLYKGFESKKFPYLKLSPLKTKIMTKQDNVNDLGITKIKLDNNITINLKKTDFKKNEAVFKVCFGKGKKSEPVSKRGLAILSENVLNTGGLAGLDKDQLQQALAGKTTDIKFSINDNYFSLSGSSSPKEAELMFQLIYHYLKEPGYREESLSLAKTLYKQQYESLMRTPDGMMQAKGDLFLAGNDTRFGLPEPETVNSYDLNDIKEWLVPYFNNGSVEVSIAGDFERKKIIALALKYLGALKKRKPFASPVNISDPISFPEGERLELKIDTKIETGVVHLAFLTDDFWDIMQTRRLSILSRVFSERLRVVIREELGESYSPYVYNAPSLIFNDYGVMHVNVNVKPENHEFVFNKVKQIVESLSAGNITEKEINLSLKPVLSHLKIIQKSNKYWLNSVMANSSTYPQKFDWANTMIKGYNSITKNDLNQLAEKYLNINKSALIVIKSETRAQ